MQVNTSDRSMETARGTVESSWGRFQQSAKAATASMMQKTSSNIQSAREGRKYGDTRSVTGGPGSRWT